MYYAEFKKNVFMCVHITLMKIPQVLDKENYKMYSEA